MDSGGDPLAMAGVGMPELTQALIIRKIERDLFLDQTVLRQLIESRRSCNGRIGIGRFSNIW